MGDNPAAAIPSPLPETPWQATQSDLYNLLPVSTACGLSLTGFSKLLADLGAIHLFCELPTIPIRNRAINRKNLPE